MNHLFLSKPAQLEEKLAEWKERSGVMEVDSLKAYTGHNVYALTFTDSSVHNDNKAKLYVTQPHAHEPATTAAMIDVIEQLVTGRDLAGNPTKLDIEKVLATTVITFNPIGNPGGVERSPYPYWDGTKVPNERFWNIMFGEDPHEPGKTWNRVDKFDVRETVVPDPIGIAYEQIDEHTYVEPNRSPLSSYSKLFRRMHEKYGYRYWLDLHQTEFANSPVQCRIFLPNPQSQPDEVKQEQEAWANRITDVWQEAGFVVAPTVPSGYRGVQAEYFRRTWGDIIGTMHKLIIEVKNNSVDTPPERQMAAEEMAIVSTIQRLIEHQRGS